jgi:hypothetical protein
LYASHVSSVARMISMYFMTHSSVPGPSGPSHP